MLEERLTDDEEVYTISAKIVLKDAKLADALGLIKVNAGRHLEHLTAHLETNGLNFLGNLIAWIGHLAELVI